MTYFLLGMYALSVTESTIDRVAVSILPADGKSIKYLSFLLLFARLQNHQVFFINPAVSCVYVKLAGAHSSTIVSMITFGNVMGQETLQQAPGSQLFHLLSVTEMPPKHSHTAILCWANSSPQADVSKKPLSGATPRQLCTTEGHRSTH